MADASLPDGHTTTDGYIDCPKVFPMYTYTTMVDGNCGSCGVKITDETFLDEYLCGIGASYIDPETGERY